MIPEAGGRAAARTLLAAFGVPRLSRRPAREARPEDALSHRHSSDAVADGDDSGSKGTGGDATGEDEEAKEEERSREAEDGERYTNPS